MLWKTDGKDFLAVSPRAVCRERELEESSHESGVVTERFGFRMVGRCQERAQVSSSGRTRMEKDGKSLSRNLARSVRFGKLPG